MASQLKERRRTLLQKQIGDDVQDSDEEEERRYFQKEEDQIKEMIKQGDEQDPRAAKRKWLEEIRNRTGQDPSDDLLRDLDSEWKRMEDMLDNDKKRQEDLLKQRLANRRRKKHSNKEDLKNL